MLTSCQSHTVTSGQDWKTDRQIDREIVESGILISICFESRSVFTLNVHAFFSVKQLFTWVERTSLFPCLDRECEASTSPLASLWPFKVNQGNASPCSITSIIRNVTLTSTLTPMASLTLCWILRQHPRCQQRQHHGRRTTCIPRLPARRRCWIFYRCRRYLWLLAFLWRHSFSSRNWIWSKLVILRKSHNIARPP